MEIDKDIQALLNEVEEKQFADYPESFNPQSFNSMEELVAHLRKIGWLK